MWNNRAIFFDRDGVINKVIVRNGNISSPWTIEEFEILPDIKEVLENLKAKGFLNIVFTNQPDIKRGFLKTDELAKMNKMMLEFLPIDLIKVCPHNDYDNCQCRKPKPGMILEVARELSIDLKNSYVVGDSWKDIEAGNKVGCRTILLSREYNTNVKNYNVVVNNLEQIYENIY